MRNLVLNFQVLWLGQKKYIDIYPKKNKLIFQMPINCIK